MLTVEIMGSNSGACQARLVIQGNGDWQRRLQGKAHAPFKGCGNYTVVADCFYRGF